MTERYQRVQESSTKWVLCSVYWMDKANMQTSNWGEIYNKGQNFFSVFSSLILIKVSTKHYLVRPQSGSSFPSPHSMLMSGQGCDAHWTNQNSPLGIFKISIQRERGRCSSFLGVDVRLIWQTNSQLSGSQYAAGRKVADDAGRRVPLKWLQLSLRPTAPALLAVWLHESIKPPTGTPVKQGTQVITTPS